MPPLVIRRIMSYKIIFKSSVSPKYKALGHKPMDEIEVDSEELDRIKGSGYVVDVVSKPKPKKKSSKKKEKK